MFFQKYLYETVLKLLFLGGGQFNCACMYLTYCRYYVWRMWLYEYTGFVPLQLRVKRLPSLANLQYLENVSICHTCLGLQECLPNFREDEEKDKAVRTFPCQTRYFLGRAQMEKCVTSSSAD